jgi:hypothetical protein
MLLNTRLPFHDELSVFWLRFSLSIWADFTPPGSGSRSQTNEDPMPRLFRLNLGVPPFLKGPIPVQSKFARLGREKLTQSCFFFCFFYLLPLFFYWYLTPQKLTQLCFLVLLCFLFWSEIYLRLSLGRASSV